MSQWDSYFHNINWSVREINKNEMSDAIKMVKEELGKNVVRVLQVVKRAP